MSKEENLLKLVIGLVAAVTLVGGLLFGFHNVAPNLNPIHLRGEVIALYLLYF